MSNGTQTRPLPPRDARPRRGDIKTLRRNGCGAWFVRFAGTPPRMVDGSETVTNPDKTRMRVRRLSLDNIVYFYPNPANKCSGYSFIQFVKRQSFKVKRDGTNGAVDPRYSIPLSPDVEGWQKRKVKKFTDLAEIFYDKGRVKKVRRGGIAREDGPGVRFRFGQPPKSLRICWEFMIYVVCDGGAKVVGHLDFSFCIRFDAAGQFALEFPAAGAEGFPSLQEQCCKDDEAFYQFIDQFHFHPRLSELPRDDKERKARLEDMRTVVDQSIQSRKVEIQLESELRDVPDPRPRERELDGSFERPVDRYSSSILVADDVGEEEGNGGLPGD